MVRVRVTARGWQEGIKPSELVSVSFSVVFVLVSGTQWPVGPICALG